MILNHIVVVCNKQMNLFRHRQWYISRGEIWLITLSDFGMFSWREREGTFCITGVDMFAGRQMALIVFPDVGMLCGERWDLIRSDPLLHYLILVCFLGERWDSLPSDPDFLRSCDKVETCRAICSLSCWAEIKLICQGIGMWCWFKVSCSTKCLRYFTIPQEMFSFYTAGL